MIQNEYITIIRRKAVQKKPETIEQFTLNLQDLQNQVFSIEICESICREKRDK